MKNGTHGEGLRFSELVNIDELRGLCESFTAITGSVTALLDLEGNILIATGWQDLCTRFHRVNITTASRCRESDTILAGKLEKGECYNVYKCRNGLVDVAVPIIIGGEHVANFFTGQFFFEPPDKEYFLRQAEEFGFDKTDYMDALSRVPVFNEKQVKTMMDFFSRLARLIGEMGLAGKSLQETNIELRKQHDLLKKSEADYRSVIENIQDVFYRSDALGDLIMASPSFSTLLEYESIDDCLGKPIAETFYYYPEKRAEFLEQIKQNGRVIAYEVVLKKRDGTQVVVETSSHFYFDDVGNFAGIEGVFRDITKRRHAEEALRDAFVKRNEMEFIINHSPAVVWLWKAAAGWPVEYVSDNLISFGYTPDDFISGRITYESIIYPDDLPKVADEVEKYTNEGRADFIQEYRIITKSGDIRWIDDRTWVRRGADGSATHYHGIIVDITERKRAEEALRSSEQFMKAVIDGSPIPQFVIDRGHHIILWNKALEEYSGIKAEDVIGTNQQWRAFYSHERPCIADLLVDGSMDRIPQWYSGKYSQSRLIKDAFEAIDFFPAMKGGTWLYFTAALLNDTDGVIIGAVETLVDITDQSRAEKALRLNAERSETLLRINQMIDAPLEEIMKYSFEEAVRLTQSEIGYLGLMNDDESDMKVRIWSRNVMPECGTDDRFLHFPVKTAGLWGEAVRQRRPIITNDYNAPHPWKKGYPEGHITIRRHMNVPVIVGAKIVLVAGVGNKTEDYDETDVQQLTLLMEGMWRVIERNRTEQELRDSQRRFADIIEFLPDATFVVDRNDCVIAWNKAIEDMTGIKAEEMLGKGNYEYAIPFYGERRPILIDLILHPDQEVEKEYTAIKRVGDSLSGEAFTPCLPGGEAYLYSTTSVLRDSTGEIIAAIECIRDNTERKKLEDQLIQAQKMEAVGRLAGGVAHDFNNMLTPIMGYTELLKRSLPHDDPRQNKLDEIIHASERSRDLVRQLLAFARKQTLEMNPVDMNRVILGFENMLRHTLHENIHLEINLTPSPGSIIADIGQVEQIILNLAVNAQDAMPDGGDLIITTSVTELDDSYAKHHDEVRAGFYNVIEISDTGEGMDLETCNRIFEPFFSTKGDLGTGLGLATVYGIVKQHGGHISVYSERGRGTTFKVYFPRYNEYSPFFKPAEVVDNTLQGHETLIVVEDQEQVRTLTVNLLKDYGYHVLEAEDVKNAMNTAASHHGDIHLLITDVILPDGNGKELYESMSVLYTDIKILYMSGYPSNVIMHHGVLDEGIQFIQKPFSMLGLMQKVREVLDKR